ncbi:C40 family peptidase [Actinomadura atramentaria]|uniref:C40 family peptidase n=1 Tax=Actinomadura atramentaria TaxID=1990 RepID=UPI0003620FDE|nr:C40 family peptidase [Actinomadura atramentaria]
MRKPDRRVLPTIIGVSVLATLGTGTGLVVLDPPKADGPAAAVPLQDKQARFVAASGDTRLAAATVAPLGKRRTPHILVAAPNTLPGETVERVRRTKRVTGVEVVDAVQAKVAGKQVGLLGVDPSTFRNFTPKPTAKADGLWRNIAAGDAAISFTMGSDGGVKLGSQIPIAGRDGRSAQVRVGAYATMGIGDVDAVVSHATAQTLGMPTSNAMLISLTEKDDARAFVKKLKKQLPKGTKAVEVNPALDYPSSTGKVPSASGEVLTAAQVQTVIKAAYTRLGWPYVWGGESEAEGGYDCSGLMQYAFDRVGIHLPRVAADQARTGWVLPYSKAQPGDMLTWANDPTNPGYISHIALYLGNGKMIAAPHTGTVVQIQNVYLTNFKGAIRVNPRVANRLGAGG